MTVKTVPNGVLVDKQTGFGTRLLTGWMSAVVRALNATTAAQGSIWRSQTVRVATVGAGSALPVVLAAWLRCRGIGSPEAFTDEGANILTRADAAAARIGDVVASGSVVDPKANGCFWTQPEIAALVIRAADIRPEHLVLEPEAGIGNLITSMRAHGHDNEVHVCELLPENQAVLVKLPNVKLVGSNFLTYAPDDATWYDRIVMNPPFSGQVDIDHVLHALDWLSPVDGVLVSIMAAGVMFRENSKTQHFMKRLAAPGVQATWHDLPDDAFLASGTRVRTVMLRVELSTAAGPRRTPVARPTPPAPTTLPTASTQAAAPAPTTGLGDATFFSWASSTGRPTATV